jgi:ribose transport system permease protein
MLASVLSAMTITSLAGSPEQIASGLYPNIGIAVFCGVVVAIASGALFGLVNGLLVTRLNLSSFLITIATTAIGLGLTLVISRGVNVPYIPRSLQSEFAIKKLFGVAPYPVVLATLIVLLFWLILTTTRFGRHTIAIGSSEEAARRAGIQTDRHNVMLFVNMGVLAGVAALLDISRFAATNIGGHQTDALQAIAAAVIGGTSLFGGVASVIGAAIGTFIPAVLANGLIILRIDPFYQLIAVGMIIIVAVYIDQRNRSSR